MSHPWTEESTEVGAPMPSTCAVAAPTPEEADEEIGLEWGANLDGGDSMLRQEEIKEEGSG